MSDQIFYLFSAVLLGLVVGALIMYFATGSNKDSEQTIAKLEKELANYQQDVAEHFEETADLVDGMTKSYKKVFDHLGKSARKLMTEEQIQEQLDLRKGTKVTLEYLTDSSEDDVVTHNEESEITETVEVSVEDSTIAEIENNESEEGFEDSIDTSSLENDELLVLAKNDSSQNDDSEKDTSEKEELEKEVEIREKNIYS